jgi:hypothetical protein
MLRHLVPLADWTWPVLIGLLLLMAASLPTNLLTAWADEAPAVAGPSIEVSGNFG